MKQTTILNSEAISSLVGDKLNDLTEIIKSTPSCLKLITKEGSLLNMNSCGLEMIGADSMDSVVGANVYDLIEESHRENFIAFNRKICSGEKGDLQFEIIGLNGIRRWMETFATPFELANGEIAHLAITNDVSSRVQGELDFKKQEILLLEESARIESLGQFVSGIAHEINNPLTIISSRAALLGIKAKKNDIEPQYLINGLETIMETVSRISDIIANLQTFSNKTDIRQKTYHSLKEIILNNLSLCTEKFKNKDIVVDVEIADDLEVFCHHGLISHAITNVLDNAYDAIEKTDDKWIRIRSRKNKNNILLTITDNGKGIRSNVAKNMMNPFYTTKGVGVGMGLGLSLASSTMKKHGGRLYYNIKSTNTQFVLEFPILQSI